MVERLRVGIARALFFAFLGFALGSWVFRQLENAKYPNVRFEPLPLLAPPPPFAVPNHPWLELYPDATEHATTTVARPRPAPPPAPDLPIPYRRP